jgi:hypothetical protein
MARNAGRSDKDNHVHRALSNRMFATSVRQARTLSPADNGSQQFVRIWLILLL